MTNREKMIAALNSDEDMMPTITEVANDYGIKISKAITPINIATAPIIIGVLETYADALKREFPSVVETAEVVRNLPHDEIAMRRPIK